MCCFSRSLPSGAVSLTRIFARPLEGGRQFLGYGMTLMASEDLAMILPIPVPARSAEDAVRFIDMSPCPTFFEHLHALFPQPPTPVGYAVPGFGPAPASKQLVVHDVGDFEASFAPTLADFARLDERFRLPTDVWASLPAYADWGFCVFKLRKTVVARAEPR